MKFSMIVAADADRGIARDGDMPWHLPGDLKHFKETTTATSDPDKQNAIIMGRSTWEALPEKWRPLPGRLNVVLSRTMKQPVQATYLVDSDLDSALKRARAMANVEALFVGGGGQVYREAIDHPSCYSIFYTRIKKSYGCDTFFPEFESQFHLESVLDEAEENDVSYRIELWLRKN